MTKQTELEKEIKDIKEHRNGRKLLNRNTARYERNGQAIIRITKENKKLPFLKAELKGITETKAEEIKFLNNLNGDMGTKYRLPKWAIKEIEERIKILEKQI